MENARVRLGPRNLKTTYKDVSWDQRSILEYAQEIEFSDFQI
jgi:hypothetical protein